MLADTKHRKRPHSTDFRDGVWFGLVAEVAVEGARSSPTMFCTITGETTYGTAQAPRPRSPDLSMLQMWPVVSWLWGDHRPHRPVHQRPASSPPTLRHAGPCQCRVSTSGSADCGGRTACRAACTRRGPCRLLSWSRPARPPCRRRPTRTCVAAPRPAPRAVGRGGGSMQRRVPQSPARSAALKCETHGQSPGETPGFVGQ